MHRLLVSLLLLLCPLAGSAMSLLAQEGQDRLLAPLSTVFAATDWPQGSVSIQLQATVHVSAHAPTDLGIGIWVSDFDGHWHQILHPQGLRPGRHQLSWRLDGHAALASEGHGAAWSSVAAAESSRGGIFFWSQHPSQQGVTVEALSAQAIPPVNTQGPGRLLQLSLPKAADGQWRISSGERTSISFVPEPFPSDPFDPDAFSGHVDFIHEDGSRQRINAFYYLPHQLIDEGDRERATPSADPHFALRFRPRQAGTYRVELSAHWAGQEPLSLRLPDLIVDGEAWDDYVRVDENDPRFFRIGSDFFWPIGLNIRSVNDQRGAERTASSLTPDRGSQSYDAYLRRLAAAGGTAAEIWMSSWNLALEWRGDWPEFRGLGRYSQARAQRLDRILDLAYELGIRINLVIRNHGQASERVDREWHHSPYNTDNGGVIAHAADFFSDSKALRYQDRYHRYLVARYADHPAILGWKLFSEVDLTAGRRDQVRSWHEHTSAVIAKLDGYGHPITTHWSGDYRNPDRVIVAQPGIHYICIDAYHGRRADGSGQNIAQLMWDSTMHPGPGRGLMQFGKPVLVTEYGGNWNAAPIPQLLAEHAAAPWAALVSGHAGMPMLWWFEWVDQNDLWNPYRALSSFLAGEDLRHPRGRAVRLQTDTHGSWAAAWVKPGHLLGYIQDSAWGFDGRLASDQQRHRITIGNAVEAGKLQLEWWDADRGILLSTDTISHPGGRLDLQTPAYRRHLAWKLTRVL
ncbi:MAG: hypothetical protein EA402_14030 [Planctomycetota bacterium]|nr:MAG: hypothetical protein EA402_14030 [Planctomycetota bacterium]